MKRRETNKNRSKINFSRAPEAKEGLTSNFQCGGNMRAETKGLPRVIQVIESEINRGGGIEHDPIRNVRQYHTLEGEKLAEHDSYETVVWGAINEELDMIKKCQSLNDVQKKIDELKKKLWVHRK